MKLHIVTMRTFVYLLTYNNIQEAINLSTTFILLYKGGNHSGIILPLAGKISIPKCLKVE